jgi:hypothetical protein
MDDSVVATFHGWYHYGYGILTKHKSRHIDMDGLGSVLMRYLIYQL